MKLSGLAGLYGRFIGLSHAWLAPDAVLPRLFPLLRRHHFRSFHFRRQSLCAHILAFDSSIVPRTSTPVLDAYFAYRTWGTRLRINYERLLRGVAATKSLSRGRGLHRRRGILDSNGLGRVSSLGIAELEFAARDRAFVIWVSDRGYTCLGLRHYCEGNSDNPDNRSSSVTKSYFARRHCRHPLRFCWIAFFAMGGPTKGRQISRSPPV